MKLKCPFLSLKINKEDNNFKRGQQKKLEYIFTNFVTNCHEWNLPVKNRYILISFLAKIKILTFVN